MSSADDARMLGERVLAGLVSGIPLHEIAADEDLTEARARSVAATALRGRARSPEAGALSGPLALARLADLERAAHSVLDGAMETGQADLALRAVDRLTAIEERRQGIPATMPGGVEEAVTAQLRDFPDRLAASAPARAAVLIGRRMDAGASAADMTSLARELRMAMTDLVAQAPSGGEDSAVDELRKRRADRELARQEREEAGTT